MKNLCFISSVEVELFKHGLIWALSSEFVGCGVWLPLWSEFKIVIHVLMSDEEVFVTELGFDHLSIELKRTDLGKLSSNLSWLVTSIDIIDGGVGWNVGEVIKVLHEV